MLDANAIHSPLHNIYKAAAQFSLSLSSHVMCTSVSPDARFFYFFQIQKLPSPPFWNKKAHAHDSKNNIVLRYNSSIIIRDNIHRLLLVLPTTSAHIRNTLAVVDLEYCTVSVRAAETMQKCKWKEVK